METSKANIHPEKVTGEADLLESPPGMTSYLQTAMKTLLEAYYEPTFSNRSHGFRPQRGCHTALLQVSTETRGHEVGS